MNTNEKNKMTAEKREQLIASISKAVEEVDAEKLQEIYLFVLHIQ